MHFMSAVRFAVRVKPGSSRTAVGGSYDGRLGPALVVAVWARAVDGAANQAVVSALADAFDVRGREVVIVTGHSARDKVVEVEGGPATSQTLATLLAANR